MRSSGIVHTPWSKSTSSQVALVSSLLRTNVKKNQPQGKPTMDVCEGTLSIMVNAIPISRRQRALPRLKHGNRSRHQALVAKLANSNRSLQAKHQCGGKDALDAKQLLRNALAADRLL